MFSLKSLNFGGPSLGETPILEPPISVRFSLFLISPHSENLIGPALMVYKFKLLAAPLKGEPPILIPPNFVKFYLFIFAYPQNFMRQEQ